METGETASIHFGVNMPIFIDIDSTFDDETSTSRSSNKTTNVENER